MAESEPTDKRSKMDVSSCENLFVRPEIFSKLWEEINFDWYRPICLLGSKGVGKTTLLKALNAQMNSNTSIYSDFNDVNWTEFKDSVSNLGRNETGSDNRKLLFLDNIQNAVDDEFGIKIIRTYVKQPDHYRRFRVVCASSRAGLLKLREDKRIHLNNGDFYHFFITPEESVTVEVMKKVIPNYSENEAVYKDWLKYVGFLVGEVVPLKCFLQRKSRSNETLPQLISLYQIYRHRFLLSVLRDDEKSFPGELKSIFVGCLAVCVLGRDVSLDELTLTYKIAETDLPWTLLKVEGEIITAVSPQAKNVMQTVVRGDRSVTEELLRLLNAVSCSGSGSMRGMLFEEVFFGALLGSEIVLKKYDCEDEKVDLKMASPVLKEINLSLLGTFVPEKNRYYHTPNMKDVDIIINANDTIYLIQCSISKDIGTKKGFWKLAESKTWNAVLVGPTRVEEQLSGKSHLASEYQQKKFAFVLGNDVLGDEFVNRLVN